MYVQMYVIYSYVTKISHLVLQSTYSFYIDLENVNIKFSKQPLFFEAMLYQENTCICIEFHA